MTLLIILSVLLAVVVIAVLAAALIKIRTDWRRRPRIWPRWPGRSATVEAEHLRPLEPAVKAINAQFDVIVGALPGIAKKAAVVAERRPA